jgi:rare lipoprotein A
MIRSLVCAALVAVSLPAAAHAEDSRAARSGVAPSPMAAIRPLPKPARHDPGCSGQRITAAFYSEGTRTASGQAFDPQAMTAAHRSLPFGTRLTVTNPRTGRSVGVTVNDRGPFVRGVTLDLTRGAAQAIGLHGTGAVCIL